MEELSKVESKIITIRDQQVIIDCDVAELYGVQTKEINQSVKNNPEKFPEGYIFLLDTKEKEEVVKIFDHLKKLKFSTQHPKAFTEKGLYMLATILKSPQAVQTSIAIIEAYSKLKELSRIIVEIPESDKAQQETLLQRSGKLVNEILDDTLPKRSSETSLELNLAMFKLKHSIKREDDENTQKILQRLNELEKLVAKQNE